MPGRDSTSNAPPSARSGVILEILTVGNSLKVSAVDEDTGTEVSFIAPVSASRADIERLAVAKLAYVMERKSGDT